MYISVYRHVYQPFSCISDCIPNVYNLIQLPNTCFNIWPYICYVLTCIPCIQYLYTSVYQPSPYVFCFLRHVFSSNPNAIKVDPRERSRYWVLTQPDNAIDSQIDSSGAAIGDNELEREAILPPRKPNTNSKPKKKSERRPSRNLEQESSKSRSFFFLSPLITEGIELFIGKTKWVIYGGNSVDWINFKF